MIDTAKIQPTHLQRAAIIYLRQSTPHQLEYNRESTERQYALVDRALELGWPREQISIVDDDLGLSGDGTAERCGFSSMTVKVALGQVGIILGIEVSRLARNNAEWYRLLDLCAMTDTLIGDDDGLYHPAVFNDRLLLGLKGTMSEAELHIIRARLDGGIRNKAARGELRRGLPVGLVWGEVDGEVRFHPDEAVCGTIRTVFERRAELGSARRVWLWLRSEELSFPLQSNTLTQIRWVAPTYTAIHKVLTNPVYAGAYVYGKTRHERYVDASGAIRKRVRHLPRDEWAVLIRDHHPGYIDWETYEANQARLAANTRPPAPPSRWCDERGCCAVAGVGHLRPLRAAVAHPLPGKKLHPRVPLCGQTCAQRPRRLLPEHRWDSNRYGSGRGLSRGARPRRPSGGGGGRRAAGGRTTTPRSRNGASPSSGPVTRASGPSGATVPWSPRSAWWPGGWRENGSGICASWARPRRSSPAASNSAPVRSAHKREGDWRP